MGFRSWRRLCHHHQLLHSLHSILKTTTLLLLGWRTLLSRFTTFVWMRSAFLTIKPSVKCFWGFFAFLLWASTKICEVDTYHRVDYLFSVSWCALIVSISSFWSFTYVILVQVKTKLKGHQKRITGLAFSNTLNVLVSSGADAQVLEKDALQMCDELPFVLVMFLISGCSVCL